jgi:activator of HSP90 ATPase
MTIDSRSYLPTRRNILAVIAAGAGALAGGSAWPQQKPQPMMEQKPATGANAHRTSIHYDLEFAATPQRFYSAILDARQFAAFSGMAAEIDPKPGGAFSMFGGLIVGRNVELIENQRIVQAWRPSSWPAGDYSIVHFELKAQDAGCALVFDHLGFAPGLYDHLSDGWKGHYWDPLKKYFASA